LALISAILMALGCTIQRTTRVPVSQLSPPALEASLADLVANINAQNQAIQTMTATVELEPTTGSVYSGVIKEYRDVTGFILLQHPDRIRIVGQAPVIRTDIFDMVSNGDEFQLYIPPKQKFIVGKTELLHPSKNALENLRPQHILEALQVPGIDSAREKYFLEEDGDGGRRYYVGIVVEPDGHGELLLNRKIWFDRSSLEIARMQFYGSQGKCVESVEYALYQDFGGVRYPARIQVTRPLEDYQLSITILKAIFNQPIAPEKFVLKKPENAELVRLASAPRPEDARGQ
jgi:outer membrane lipoprotein-sorting protein